MQSISEKRCEVLKSLEDTRKLFEGYESKEYLAVDVKDGRRGSLWIVNNDKRKIEGRRLYINSKDFEILVKALNVAGENDCLNKPMDVDEFKVRVTEDSTIYRGDVNNWLKVHPGKDIFEFNEKIRLKYPFKEIWTK